MVFAIFASLIGVTILEIFVVIKVADAIGRLPTIGLMVLDAAIGTWLLRSQGRAVWRRFQVEIASGRVPGREVLDAALVAAGGAFLITPGFVTDVVGALLLIPPTRAFVRRRIVRRLQRSASAAIIGRVSTPGRTRPAAGPDGFDVDGTATEVGREELRS